MEVVFQDKANKEIERLTLEAMLKLAQPWRKFSKAASVLWVGMAEGISRVAEAGDSVESIAAEHGHVWQTLWDHASNQALREPRKNPPYAADGGLRLRPGAAREDGAGEHGAAAHLRAQGHSLQAAPRAA